MQLTLWFWPHILAFVALHTSVARLVLWLRFDGRLNARPTPGEIMPGCRATHELRRDVEDGRRKVSAVGHELAEIGVGHGAFSSPVTLPD
jgi:hypothetical protein